jgi:CHAD domain-containing protein
MSLECFDLGRAAAGGAVSDRAATLETLRHRLGSGHQLREEPAHRIRWQMLDSFDWRVYKAGYALAFDGQDLHLLDRETGVVTVRGPLDACPVWDRDLPEGPCTDLLAGALEMRALVGKTTIERIVTPYTVLDELEKTVARLEVVEAVAGDDDPLLRHLLLKPVKGYGKVLDRIRLGLAEMGLDRPRREWAETIYQGVGLTPLDYNPKPNWTLKPEMPAQQAGKVIFARLLEVMLVNLPGLKQDIDTEFLHDFRVAVRRTRSGLSQIKNIFDGETTQRAKADFASLGKWTNLLRDLDVYLLDRERLTQLLPEEFRADLDPFFEHLETQREAEQRRLHEHLESAEFDHIVQWWRDFLEQPPDQNTAPAASVPIIEQAGPAIAKRYRRIRNKAKHMSMATPDAELHRMRIDCKKLRYLLEFFGSLYPGKKTDKLVRRLKKLQDALGAFNDLHVQQTTLRREALTITLNRYTLRPTVLAIGLLIGLLQDRHLDLKQDCLDRIARFIDDETRTEFKTLFTAAAT